MSSPGATQISRAALPLRDSGDLDPVMERIGAARLVLVGEATHGTGEFYRWRAELTRRLVAEQGFGFVGVEGDWPDCHRVHCSVTAGPCGLADPQDALAEFVRWPRWMWANEEVVDFTRWLAGHNEGLPAQRRVGFHGLDVYSLYESLRAVLDYVAENEPDHLPAARQALRCFEPYGEDPQLYALISRMVPRDCEAEVGNLLSTLQTDRLPSAPTGAGALDDRFIAEQNAEVVADAERYYRVLVGGGAESWNVRDHHIADTLDRLLRRYGPDSRAIVWAHNTHVGDSHATDMAAAGMVNIGRLARERYGEDTVALVGFGTHRGSVVASDHWGGPVREMTVPSARPGSLEALLHDATNAEDAAFVLPRDAGHERDPWLRAVLDHRAIGVVYQPELERRGNYVPTVLGRRYDCFLYCDHTSAVRPLHGVERPDVELETYPTGY